MFDSPTPSQPQTPTAAPPPPMFQADASKKPKKQGSAQPTFLGAETRANPTNTGQKTLLGQ